MEKLRITITRINLLESTASLGGALFFMPRSCPASPKSAFPLDGAGLLILHNITTQEKLWKN